MSSTDKPDFSTKLNPDERTAPAEPQTTNYQHPTRVGSVDPLPGAGIVRKEADASIHDGGPGREAPRAVAVAPGAQRVGTTEGRAATAARGGVRGGLGELEAPSAQGQTAYAGATDDDGSPQPEPSGIRATSDPNFTAQRADEEGTPSEDALEEQAESLHEEQGQ